jgi:hypothetical protein
MQYNTKIRNSPRVSHNPKEASQATNDFVASTLFQVNAELVSYAQEKDP